MKFIIEELQIDEDLKQRLVFICDFANVTPTFINGTIRKIDRLNLFYIEPHKAIIKGQKFMLLDSQNRIAMYLVNCL